MKAHDKIWEKFKGYAWVKKELRRLRKEFDKNPDEWISETRNLLENVENLGVFETVEMLMRKFLLSDKSGYSVYQMQVEKLGRSFAEERRMEAEDFAQLGSYLIATRQFDFFGRRTWGEYMRYREILDLVYLDEDIEDKIEEKIWYYTKTKTGKLKLLPVLLAIGFYEFVSKLPLLNDKLYNSK